VVKGKGRGRKYHSLSSPNSLDQEVKKVANKSIEEAESLSNKIQTKTPAARWLKKSPKIYNKKGGKRKRKKERGKRATAAFRCVLGKREANIEAKKVPNKQILFRKSCPRESRDEGDNAP